MSLNPIDHRPAWSLFKRSGESDKPPIKQKRRKGLGLGLLIKQMLPRTLFGRSILILVMPLILVQAVTTWVYYDRLLETVMRRMASGVAGEIAMVIDTQALLPRKSDRSLFLTYANQTTELGFQILPGAQLPDDSEEDYTSNTFVSKQLETALIERLTIPFHIDDYSSRRTILVSIQLPDEVLIVSVPVKRLFTSTAYIFLLWMVGTAVFTFFVATLFLRNQVRSLRRLAFAAEAFGKGRDVPSFKPEGAAEVRQAAAAFLKMRERLQRQITQRTEMLAGVSHDLRTPLTRMKLELELLGDHEDIEGLKSDVSEMQQMIEGYLSFARGEGNEQPAVCDLVSLLNDAMTTARRDGITIDLHAPHDLHIPVRRDALRRAIMNLLNNAGRYGGAVQITLIPGRQSVDIVIDDDGPGIPEDQREAVFRPFFRLESSRNMTTGGVGLGLTIARDILRSHGGDLTLGQSPKSGLRARLTLPR